MNDARGTPLSYANPAALAGYESAVRSFQNYVGDPVALLDDVLTEHPDFRAAHLLRAAILLAAGERRALGPARRSLAAAEAIRTPANEREKGFARALGLLSDGDWHRARAELDAVLVDEPRDVVTLQTAHLWDFFCGDALNLRNRVARVLPDWDISIPGFSYVLGMHAFGLEECNQYPEAEQAGRRALELERRDGWAVHAVTHVMEMTGRIDEGIAWLGGRRADWAPGSTFAFHNFWHLALFHLDTQNYAAALDLFDRDIYPARNDACVVLVDAASLLWRLYLDGVDVASRAQIVADVWRSRAKDEHGFYAFNDAHATMALCAAGAVAEARDWVERLDAVVSENRGANRPMTADVGLPLAKALIAFADGEYRGAIGHALPVRDRAHAFGGSHAQRDVITLTLIEAALRSGNRRLARHLIAERTVQKPESAWGWRLLRRAS
jgi:tetratricopeptide (TPR) repeat protein